MSSKLTLSIAGLEVVLTRFPNEDCPRTRINVAEMTYTAAGTAVGSGSLYEPKHLWDVTVICDKSQVQLLKSIYAAHDHFRRSLQPADVLILDTTQLYEEFGARSRAIVADTEAITQGPVTLYYAQFKGWFSAAPKLNKLGAYWVANFQLMETDKHDS